MYHIHTTHALVVGMSPVGEKHYFITLFTKDFGMIRARAQSVRLNVSKLRFALQEYSFVNVSLVRGKDVWRITNAEPLYNIYFELKDNSRVFALLARSISLVRRLLPEEGSELGVFDDMFSVCDFVIKNKFSDNELVTIEWLFVLRVLHSLGYIRSGSLREICENEDVWQLSYIHSVEPQKEIAIYTINEALKASHL